MIDASSGSRRLAYVALAVSLGACRGAGDGGAAMDVAADAVAEDGAADGEGHPDGDAAASPDTASPRPACLRADGADPAGTDTLDTPLGVATVRIEDRASCLRTYTLTSTAERRDGLPASPRVVAELAGWPTTRTGNDLFDALHALALEEVREDSVDEIRDGAFNHNAPVSCGDGGCFETGRKWSYVWTRDTAYAVDLGLAALDPRRAANSLRFKLSERRGGGDLQIVQDTGSGGSYPVSTDRVAWVRGARAVLAHLEGAERDAFFEVAREAVTDTVEHDRDVVWDPESGLYFGEQSFLDWREQSYPAWTEHDVIDIATSRCLSTNVLHYDALRFAAELSAEAGDASAAARYAGWADALREAIRARLWVADAGQFATYLPTPLDPVPVHRWDLLGASLVVLSGVADASQAAAILAGYPHYGPGAPVIWPQQQLIAVYHNRGEWPFVDAYWLRAAKRAGNDAVTDRMVAALMRGAALNLSNMENFEAATGAPWLDDGTASGPVVNSQRQLWSVAGYLSMVHHTLFGLEATREGLRVQPWLTRRLRDGLFGGTDTLVLNHWPYRGRAVTVVLHLPPKGDGQTGGALRVAAMALNGAAVEDPSTPLPAAALTGGDLVEVTLEVDPAAAPATLTMADPGDWRAIYGPRTPFITAIEETDGGKLSLSLASSEDDRSAVRFDVWRDGARIAADLPGTTARWTDPDADAGSAASPCYAVEAVFPSTGNRSQRSRAVCWWGRDGGHIQRVDAAAMTAVGGVLVEEYGRHHYQGWGAPGDTLTASGIQVATTGRALFQVAYGNGAGPLNTGITCAVKRLEVRDAATGALVARGVLTMPQLGRWDRWALSSLVPAELEAGRTYDVVISADERTVNMSSFAHFEAYTGGTGGADGPYNDVNIAELRVLVR